MKALETGSAEHIETSTINLARDRVTLRNVPSVVVEIRSPHGLFPRFESRVEEEETFVGRRPHNSSWPCVHLEEIFFRGLKVKQKR